MRTCMNADTASLVACHATESGTCIQDVLLLPFDKLQLWFCENCSVPTVVFDVVPPGAPPCVPVEMFRELGVFEMAEVHGDCDMNRPSVLLHLLNYF